MADVDLSENRGGTVINTAAALLALSWISLLLRVYVRAALIKSFRVDDYLMVGAQVVFTVMCALVLNGVATGIGRHNQALEQYQMIESQKWQSLAVMMYIVDMMLVKLSIGIFLLRLSIEVVYQWILWTSLFIIGVWSMVLLFWNLFHCSPVEAQWDYTIPNVRCPGPQAVVSAAYAHSAMTIASDWLYALLPIPMVWGVKMTKQEKATVIFVLGLGIFASIATLIRMKYLTDLGKTSDILYVGTDAMIWTLIEPGIAITAASLATIRPLLRKWRLRGFDASYYLRSGRSGGPSAASGASASWPSRPSVMSPPRMLAAARSSPGDLTLIDLECGPDLSTGGTTRRTSPTSLAGAGEFETELRGGGGIGVAITCDGQEEEAAAVAGPGKARDRMSIGIRRILGLPPTWRRYSTDDKSGGSLHTAGGPTVGEGSGGSRSS